MKRVLVTGASGFIGRNALPSLQQRGYEVHACYSREIPEELKRERCSWHQLDVHDANRTAQLLADLRPESLLHFAWDVTPGKYTSSPENLRWVSSSLNLLLEFQKHGGRRVVCAGSCFEYEHGSEEVLTEYDSPLHPATLYGISKKALQLILESFAAQVELSWAWGRIFYLYGPVEYPSRLVPSAIRAMLAQKPFPCSEGTQVRDYMHARDVADAFVALLDSEVQGAVNIASGQGIAIRDLLRLISARVGGPELLRFGALPDRQEAQSIIADVTRLRAEVGWQPKFSLESGLDDVIAWWRVSV